MEGTKCFMQKARGMVRDVFRTRNMRALPGKVGLGQVRYPTAGNAYSEEEAQPFYVNAPYGIVLVHNGNLTNAASLKQELFDIDRRHINTGSDTEVLINVLAHELERAARDRQLSPEEVFAAVACRCTSGSAARTRSSRLIAGHGLLAFRDPFGIRPLAFGEGVGPDGPEVMVASESVAIVGTGPRADRGRRPGRGDLHRPRGHRCTRASAPSTRSSSRACSSTSTWRGPTRSWTASRSTRLA
jgi:amidophosphoribosyltransferase